MTPIYLVFLFVLPCIAVEKRFPIWGTYCGKGHSNQYGKEPVDLMDRYCQYHDICVTSLGLMSCWCNEQLYYLVSNVEPYSEEESHIKDSILRYIYLAISGCENYYDFERVVVSQTFLEPENKGYNYIPFYPSYISQNYQVRLGYNSTGHLLLFTEAEFNEFTIDVYRNPVFNFPKWRRNEVAVLNAEYFAFTIDPGQYYIIYNPSPEYSVYEIKDNTYCPESPRQRSDETAYTVLYFYVLLSVCGCCSLLAAINSLIIIYKPCKTMRKVSMEKVSMETVL